MYRIMPVDIYSTMQLDAWLGKMAQKGWRLTWRRGMFCKFSKITTAAEQYHVSNPNPQSAPPSDQVWKTLCRQCIAEWFGLAFLLIVIHLCNLYITFKDPYDFERFLEYQSFYLLTFLPVQLCSCFVKTGHILSAHAARVGTPNWKLRLRKALHFMPIAFAVWIFLSVTCFLSLNLGLGNQDEKFCNIGKAVPTWERIETDWTQQAGEQQEVTGCNGFFVPIASLNIRACGEEGQTLYYEYTQYATYGLSRRGHQLAEGYYQSGGGRDNWTVVNVPEALCEAFSNAGIHQYAFFQGANLVVVFWRDGKNLIRLNASLETTSVEELSDLVVAAVFDSRT